MSNTETTVAILTNFSAVTFAMEDPKQRRDAEIILGYVFEACEEICDAWPCAGE